LAKILVIDDEESVLNIIKAVLERSNHIIETTSNGLEAITKMNENPADLVITDLTMPEKSGQEIIKEIRQGFPDTKIIVISGKAQIYDKKNHNNTDEIYGQRLIAKPFQPKVLVSIVNEVLGN